MARARAPTAPVSTGKTNDDSKRRRSSSSVTCWCPSPPPSESSDSGDVSTTALAAPPLSPMASSSRAEFSFASSGIISSARANQTLILFLAVFTSSAPAGTCVWGSVYVCVSERGGGGMNKKTRTRPPRRGRGAPPGPAGRAQNNRERALSQGAHTHTSDMHERVCDCVEISCRYVGDAPNALDVTAGAIMQNATACSERPECARKSFRLPDAFQ